MPTQVGGVGGAGRGERLQGALLGVVSVHFGCVPVHFEVVSYTQDASG